MQAFTTRVRIRYSSLNLAQMISLAGWQKLVEFFSRVWLCVKLQFLLQDVKL